MIRMVENTYEYILMHMERFRLDEQNHSSQLDKTCYDYEYDVYQKIIFYLIFSSALLRLTYLCDDAHGDKKVLQQLLSYM